jgi:deferrochelatase/peroxidase EfeB
MQTKLQNGIFYLGTPKIGNSCHVAFVRAGIGTNSSEVGEVLVKLWSMLKNLEKGEVYDLNGVHARHLHPGNLSILVGYGPEIFSIKGVKRQKPLTLTQNTTFKMPSLKGGGPIIENSEISYSKDIVENEALSEQIILQFVGDNEFITSRASYETWKLLSKFHNSQGNDILYLTNIFTGFQRDDRRNWFGFHDGVSNLSSKDRFQVICIANNDVTDNDRWTINGTYMAFLRIEFDVDKWNRFNDNDQSIIIGRDKITGCPLIGVDKNKLPIKDKRCPVRGTYEVLEKGNEIFREHSPFGKQMYLPSGISDTMLLKSHVGTANPTKEQSDKTNAYRIYRQGFEFLEPIRSYPGFRVGLNFISFQKSPNRLFNILRHSSSKEKMQNQCTDLPSFDSFFTVRTAGIFIVPPLVANEPFPGARILLDELSISNMNKSKSRYAGLKGQLY